MTYWWLNFMHTQPISLQICKHVAFCFLRCERRGECTTSGVPKLLLLQMPWAQSLTAQTRHSTVSLTLHRTTSPPLMGWSTRFAALNICWDENKLLSTLLIVFFFLFFGFVCFLLLGVDKVVRRSCAWWVCKCLPLFRKHAEWYKCCSGGHAQVLFVCLHYIINMPTNYSSPTLILFLQHRTLLAYIDKNGKLPSTWFLQLDNTCK